jgi:hypothetical protein
MKIVKSIQAYVLIIITAATILASCNSPAEKVVLAEQKVSEANQELDEANAEYLEEVELYRRETAARIAYNNESIAAFNKRIESEKAEVRDEYRKAIKALEEKNTDMQRRLDSYKADGKDKWEIFKAEFNRDMDNLGKAFSDLTVSNVKK